MGEDGYRKSDLSSFPFCSGRRMRCDESAEGHSLQPTGIARDDRTVYIVQGISWRASENSFLCGPIFLHGPSTEPPPPDEGAPAACRCLPGDSHSTSDPGKRVLLPPATGIAAFLWRPAIPCLCPFPIFVRGGSAPCTWACRERPLYIACRSGERIPSPRRTGTIHSAIRPSEGCRAGTSCWR